MLEIQLGHPGAQLQDPEPQMMVKKCVAVWIPHPIRAWKLGEGVSKVIKNCFSSSWPWMKNFTKKEKLKKKGKYMVSYYVNRNSFVCISEKVMQMYV